MTGQRHTVKRQLAFVLVFALLSLVAARCLASTGIHDASQEPPSSSDALVRGFQTPPESARLRCYWWWLNGHTDEKTITRDLEEMKAKGYGGALLVDANGADGTGNNPVPAGPTFGSPEWTALYLHALRTAHRLGLEITLNITSGWNLGAPFITPKDANKVLTWTRTIVDTNTREAQLAVPAIKNGYYQRIAVLAYPLHHGAALAGQDGDSRAPRKELSEKSAAVEVGFSTPKTDHLMFDPAGNSGDQDANIEEVRDVTASVDAQNRLHWKAPSKGPWEILTIGYTSSNARLSPGSGAWQGLSLDHLDPAALDLYWDKALQPLLDAAKPYLGNTLRYLATDSWEMGGMNWTGKFREEFRKRRGYDPVPYLPIVAGRILNSREQSDRFLTDFRRTIGDLTTQHFDHMAERAAKMGLGIECESGGPHGEPIDALETFRHAAVPQTEYWAMSPIHRSADTDRYFVKEAASAAHIYGQRLVAAEGMTSIGNQWNESIGMNLKPSFDQALTEGLNRLVWHEFTSSPAYLGLPGQEYFAGTHLNPNVTWWRDASAFLLYLNRSQFLQQQGQPVNDILYYYGDNVPNFVRLKRDDPAKVLPGYDYDVTNTDALLNHILITSGDLRTPEGIHYRALVLPRSRILPLAVLQLAQRYVQDGGVLIGLRPLRSQGIVSEHDDKQFATIANDLWKPCEQNAVHRRKIAKGELFCTDNAHEVMQQIGVLPDMEAATPSQTASLDYVHRITDGADIYFIRNTQPKPLQATITLRVAGKQPEIFNAVTGEVHRTLLFTATADGRTAIPLSLGPYDSLFITFRHPAQSSIARIVHDDIAIYDAAQPGKATLPPGFAIQNDAGSVTLQTSEPGNYEVVLTNGQTKELTTDGTASIPIPGPWTLSFPPNWGAPPQIHLNNLKSWTESTDPGIRYFSGTATYHTTLHLIAAQLATTHSTWLDLGEVHEVASVRINGRPATILWKHPFTVRVDKYLHTGDNVIEIDVTNLWPNRLIGDAQSPTGKRYTWTNIREYTSASPLLPSGLLGPVVLRPLYLLPLK